MNKIDLKKELKYLYHAPAKNVILVDVPPMNFLMADGEGDPNTSRSFAEAVEALFAVAYAVKFTLRNGSDGIDYGVMPLEALWWADDLSVFSDGRKSLWKWTLMIMQPGFVTGRRVEEAIEEVKKKKDPAALPLVRFEEFSEGRCAQIMHTGPFSEEGPAIEKVQGFIDEIGQKRGKHHEIYLSDMRRTDSSKWKTIVRQPFG
ncbi:MAG: hypothetical protein HGA62_03115 [Chlorobiaceae bacterium]|nr:hypothetical protein [Chlorobiaceae bacterium]NTV61135.1 hypothetical protein [Chlorobiaceae bacterium]